jgi:hypothetical protein
MVIGDIRARTSEIGVRPSLIANQWQAASARIFFRMTRFLPWKFFEDPIGRTEDGHAHNIVADSSVATIHHIMRLSLSTTMAAFLTLSSARAFTRAPTFSRAVVKAATTSTTARAMSSAPPAGPMPYDDDKMPFYALGTNLAMQVRTLDLLDCLYLSLSSLFFVPEHPISVSVCSYNT